MRATTVGASASGGQHVHLEGMPNGHEMVHDVPFGLCLGPHLQPLTIGIPFSDFSTLRVVVLLVGRMSRPCLRTAPLSDRRFANCDDACAEGHTPFCPPALSPTPCHMLYQTRGCEQLRATTRLRHRCHLGNWFSVRSMGQDQQPQPPAHPHCNTRDRH